MVEKYKDVYYTKHIEPLFEKYKDIPTEYKYLLIEKDYTKMFGKRYAQEKLRYMYEDSEDFIIAFRNAVAEFSFTVKKNLFIKNFPEGNIECLTEILK